MDSNWASEQLQTIRTLMERSALYRRALAPIMLYVGAIGIIAGIVGWKIQLHSSRGFIGFWIGAAVIALIGSFLLVRRQAFKDSEPFWSPPTRRVAQALLPALFIGCFLGCLFFYILPPGDFGHGTSLILVILWTWFYGCAAHAAGFFMTRGIKLFGWVFIILGCVLSYCIYTNDLGNVSPHLVMGAIFGGLHFIYGIYLYLTEKGKNAA